jgi:hypothetical protein
MPISKNSKAQLVGLWLVLILLVAISAFAGIISIFTVSYMVKSGDILLASAYTGTLVVQICFVNGMLIRVAVSQMLSIYVMERYGESK